jgi:hypothetical protein
MLKKIKQFKLRGNDTVFGEKFSDVIHFPKGPSSLGKEVKSRDFPIIKQPYTAKESSAVNEMIFDEGIPMKFLHKVIKGKK